MTDSQAARHQVFALLSIFSRSSVRRFAVVAGCLLAVRAEAGVFTVPIIELSGPGIGTDLPDGRLPEIGSGVGHLQTHIPANFGGAEVNTLIGANTFYANGITGQGSVTANVEAGHIWSGHESLGHVSQFVQDASAWNDPGTPGAQQSDLFDRHATWVGMHIGGRLGGPIGGQGTHQTGIAYNTDLKSGAIASSWTGNAFALGFNFTGNSFTLPYNTYFGSTDVINSSWGGTDPTATNSFAMALDGMANTSTRTTFVTSAGNS